MQVQQTANAELQRYAGQNTGSCQQKELLARAWLLAQGIYTHPYKCPITHLQVIFIRALIDSLLHSGLLSQFGVLVLKHAVRLV